MLLALFGVSGVLDGYHAVYGVSGEGGTIPQTFLIAALCFLWCRTHAEENGRSRSMGYAIFCGLFAVIGIPFYGFAAYGLKRGGVIFLKGVVFACLSVLLNCATDEAAYTLFSRGGGS